jgi:Isoleucyl-tRNA synthetase
LSVVDKCLEERMQIAQDVSSAVLALRRKESIKVRQPLMQIMIPVMNDAQRQDIEAVRDLILTEVNVKELNYVDNAAGILVKKVKPDFKKLGPRYGKIMKQLAAEVQAMPQEAIVAFEKDGSYSLNIDGQTAIIELADVEIISEDIPGWLVANAGKFTVALDVTITDGLKKEGIARELVNRIQNMRKSGGLDITDRIIVKISDREQIREAISEYNGYIASQVLADKIELLDVKNGQEVDMDDYILLIEIVKV